MLPTPGPLPLNLLHHNQVERNRREKARAYVRQLQGLLPNACDHSYNPNINTILANTLEFLQGEDGDGSQRSTPQDEDEGTGVLTAMSPFRKMSPSILPDPFNDPGQFRYMMAFETSPIGVILARVDGTLVASNPMFDSFFGFSRGSARGNTMFALTHPSSMQTTMQVERLAFSPH